MFKGLGEPVPWPPGLLLAWLALSLADGVSCLKPGAVSSKVLGVISSDLGVKVYAGRNEVDVGADVRGNRILVASYVSRRGLLMLEYVILRLEERFCLLNASLGTRSLVSQQIKAQPRIIALLYSLRTGASLDPLRTGACQGGYQTH